jgi:hypothetical protein
LATNQLIGGSAVTSDAAGKVAVLWRGNRQARDDATPQNNRFHRVFEELAIAGIQAEPAVYSEDMADEVRAQLLKADGVLVWVDPLSEGRTRRDLDALLRDVARGGVWVSTHPDVTLKIGTKEVLHTTSHLGWGTDTHIYRTVQAFRDEFPRRLQENGPRVIKQNRGNGGQGVWKVERLSGATHGSVVYALEARRGSEPHNLPLSSFMEICESYFTDGGLVIDQPFQERLKDGMIRCYVGVDKVVGFGHQLIKALLPPPPEGASSKEAEPGPRIMHLATAPEFEALRAKMDDEWIPQMMQVLGIDRASLPIIWDADFLYGPRTDAGEDSFVLCEINVSSVFAIPDQAPKAIAKLTRERLLASRKPQTF